MTEQLVCLYSKGTDKNVEIETIVGQFSNRTIGVFDTLIGFRNISTVDINNPSNLMTVGSSGGKSFMGSFKVLSQDGPGPLLVGTYDPAVNANSRYYQITSSEPDSAVLNSVSTTNTFNPEKIYDFAMLTYDNRNNRKLYIKETTQDTWTRVYEDLIRFTDGIRHPVASFGFFANSNVVMNNLRVNDAGYNYRESYKKEGQYINPLVHPNLSDNTVTAIAFRDGFNYPDNMFLLQVPNSGSWGETPYDILALLSWDENSEDANAYTPLSYNAANTATYPNIKYTDWFKVGGLKSSSNIPQIIIDALPTIESSVPNYGKTVFATIKSAISSGTVVYFEQSGRPDNTDGPNYGSYSISNTAANYTKVVLVDTVSLVILELKYVFNTNTYNWDDLPQIDAPSVVAAHGDAGDTVTFNDAISGRQIKLTDDIKFSDFWEYESSGINPSGLPNP